MRYAEGWIIALERPRDRAHRHSVWKFSGNAATMRSRPDRCRELHHSSLRFDTQNCGSYGCVTLRLRGEMTQTTDAA